ncbi:hypothetical protein LB503_007139 [Fusarium chuoi]|nr:hypothetical protein LB503_007139 [Fusarium chuoi]
MSDSKKGGDLFDMAKDGTSSESLPSNEMHPQYQHELQFLAMLGRKTRSSGLGSSDLAGAADNAVLSASEGREFGVGEGISATGHDIPQSVTGKPGGRGGTKGKEEIRRDHWRFRK